MNNLEKEFYSYQHTNYQHQRKDQQIKQDILLDQSELEYDAFCRDVKLTREQKELNTNFLYFQDWNNYIF